MKTTTFKKSRIEVLSLSDEVQSNFLKSVSSYSLQDIEYTPYKRYLLAKELLNQFEGDFHNNLIGTIKSRKSGAILLTLNTDLSKPQTIKLTTAIAYLLGHPNIDVLSGKYFACFTLENTENAPSKLWQPYEKFTLHTDGTFVEEKNDWIMLTKLHEENAIGGETRLLHLDDWEEKSVFMNNKFAQVEFNFLAPPPSDPRRTKWGNHRTLDGKLQKIFKHDNGGYTVSFVDQFIHPKSIDEAEFLSDLLTSFESSQKIIELELEKNSVLILNNNFWLHGRAAFKKNEKLKRELLRIRGSFK